MNILVCISHVPDTTSKINFGNNDTEFIKDGLQFIIGPNDEFGLTKALFLKEKNGGSITVINVGGPETEPTLRKALAIGADAAVRIDAAATDGYFVAQQIASYAKENAFDLIICGTESIDYNGGQVPGMVAELLGIPFVQTCIGLEVEGSEATVIREIDGGKETLKGSLPMVIAGKKGLVEEKDLRIPNMRGIMMARQKSLTVHPAVEAETGFVTEKYERPAEKGACTMIDADNIDELVRLLHEEAKVI